MIGPAKRLSRQKLWFRIEVGRRKVWNWSLHFNQKRPILKKVI